MRVSIARFAVPAVVLLAIGAQHGIQRASAHGEKPTYDVAILLSLGGTRGAGNSINDRGWVAGFSNLPDDRSRHATLWISGFRVDLGTLGGPNSAVLWPVKNTQGLIAGVAQTNIPEPNNEDWSCSAFFPTATATGYICLGVVWEFGRIRALPTLVGGHNSFATGANNHRQVVGWSENGVRDSECEPPQVLQFLPVVWGPGRDDIEDLPPFPGDSVGAATAINDRGQVVGISGKCDQAVGRFSAQNAVLWEDGSVQRIDHLGGVAWHTPMAINERGEVVGFSNHSPADGGMLNPHGFLWTRQRGTRPLRPFPGDVTSQALGINERRQVVGQSCAAACRAFLWEDGVMTDLNERVAPGTHTLWTANDINDEGQITGRARDRSTGEFSVFVATPIRRHDRE